MELYNEFMKNGVKYYVKGEESEDGTYTVILAKEVANAWNVVTTMSFPDASTVTQKDVDTFLKGFFA